MSISALNNLKIEYQENIWQLSLKDNEPLVKVTRDGALFSADFAMRRRMPQQLSNGLISRIVLGWSDTDLSWHLGFLVSQDVADWRGSRWCSLARWSELETPEAREAAEALAQTLDRTLRVVPPRNITFGATSETVVLSPAEPEAEVDDETPNEVYVDEELLKLPLELGEWRFENYHSGYQYVRLRNWYLSQWMSFLWYAFWSVTFLVLSIRSITVDLALPNSGIIFPRPELLPYIGIAAGLLIFLIALNTLRKIVVYPNRIIIDSAQRSIHILHNKTEKWRLKSVDIDSLYVSHVVYLNKNKFSIEHAEFNVLTTWGVFKRILVLEEEDVSKIEGTPKVTNAVLPLSRVRTPLQASLYFAAQALKVPIWYDQRT